MPAIVPLRVLPLDPPVKDGLIPGFKLGAVEVTPFGFIKATVSRDSSAPNGDDFPFPGIFLNSSSHWLQKSSLSRTFMPNPSLCFRLAIS